MNLNIKLKLDIYKNFGANIIHSFINKKKIMKSASTIDLMKTSNGYSII